MSTESAVSTDSTEESPMVPEPDLHELLQAVRALTERVAHLEAELAASQEAEGVPEDVVVAISAAVAAFFGHRAKVRQVRYRSGAAYSQQGRAWVQEAHYVHGSR